MYEIKPTPRITILYCKDKESAITAIQFAFTFIKQHKNRNYLTYSYLNDSYYVKVTRYGNIIVEKI